MTKSKALMTVEELAMRMASDAECMLDEDHMVRMASLLPYAELLVQLTTALDKVEDIMWMARNYAEGGGSNGPEMRDFLPAEDALLAALASADRLLGERE